MESKIQPTDDIMWSLMSNSEIITLCAAIVESNLCHKGHYSLKLYQSDGVRSSHMWRDINNSGTSCLTTHFGINIMYKILV